MRMYVRMCTVEAYCILTHTCIRTYVYMYVHTYVRTYVCTYICLCTIDGGVGSGFYVCSLLSLFYRDTWVSV